MGLFSGLKGIGKYYNFSGVGQLAGIGATAAVNQSLKTTPPETFKNDLQSLADGRLSQAHPDQPYTQQEISDALKEMNGGKLAHADGSAMREGDLDLLTKLANEPNPQIRADLLAAQKVKYEAAEQRRSASFKAGEQAGGNIGTALSEHEREERRDEKTANHVETQMRRYYAKQH